MPEPTARIRSVQQAVTVGDNVEISTRGGSSETEIQSEQSLVPTTVPILGGVSGLVVGYNDNTDMINRNVSPPALYPGSSLMGYAWSYDDGATWTQGSQLAVPEELSQGAIRGDPTLAVDDSGAVWYAAIAQPDLSQENRGFVLALSIDGGGSFNDPIYVDTQEYTDRPFMAAGWGRLHVTYFAGNSRVRHMYLEEGETWVGERIPASSHPNATVVLDPFLETHVYLTFQRPSAVGGSWEVAFLLSTQSGRPGTFQETAVPVTNAQPLTEQIASTNPDYYVRNPSWYAFVIDEGNWHCDIVWESEGAIFFTSTADAYNWPSQPVPITDEDKLFFQPTIAYSPANRIAVMYYGQDVLTKATHVYARVSDDHGATWSAQTQLTKNSPEGNVPFIPCVTSGNYFGDYIGLAPTTEPPGGFFGAWADSRRGCSSCCAPFTATHQHTMGALFW